MARVGEPKPRQSGARSREEHLDAIVEAAVRCFGRWGVARTRVDDIAAELGKQRPYLYRYFAGKDAIVAEVVVRSIRQHYTALRERFPIAGPAADLIVGSLAETVRHGGDNPYTAALVADASTHATAQALASLPEVLTAVRHYWEPILAHAGERGELRAGLETDAACRWLIFLQFSYLALPELIPDDDDELIRQLREHVVPSLLERSS